jgi:BirA family biotin operon repressor/biotin-[acetyl-CoA-carboxylase] ligase
VGTNAPRAPLDKSAITSELSQYWRVSVVDVTTSTQDEISKLISNSSVISNQVVVAEFQSNGRGRLDRSFDATKSSALLFSFNFTPKRSQNDWGFLTLITGMAVARSLNAFVTSAVPVTLKWPNDLLIGDKKLGGIIAEVNGSSVIIGVGINIEMNLEELPVESATSLLISGASSFDRNKILAKILNELESALTSWDSGEIFVDRYREVSSTLGKQVRVQLPNGDVLESRAMDIDPSGGLILESGERITVGDVIHLR